MKEKLESFNKEITVSGFLDSFRDLPYVIFLVIRNNGEKLQVTIEKENTKELVDTVSNLTLESTLKITGVLKRNENVKLNQKELIPSKIEITSISLEQLPINIKEKNNALRETRLDYRFLDLRREDNNLFFKCQTTLLKAMRDYFYNNDFIEINSPKISASNAESGAEVFKLDYFSNKACLSQSPQFYKQMAMASDFNRVFEIAPVFRAENSHTSYHATEIEMIDAEISWINSFEDVMDLEEEWLRYSFKILKEKHNEEIKKTFNVEVSDVTNKFPRITFDECKKILKENYNFVAFKTDDLEREEEKLICQYAKEKYNSDFIFITNFPVSARSFYIMKDDKNITQSYDLLFKGIEITSGGQREHRPEKLKEAIINKGINPNDLQFYIDFFKYGCPPHGGFGVGLARIMMQIFEIDNIREATFIYRGPTRLTP